MKNNTPNKFFKTCLGFFAGLGLSCQLMAAGQFSEQTVASVDLERFMGPWYVHGHTPLVLDDNSSNQIESYEMNEDGSIATTFSFKRAGRDWTLTPKATVADTESNAHWKMQFVWPFRSDYLIVRLADDYSSTVISVPSKNLIWILTRNATLADEQYDAIVADLEADGYPVAKLRRVPQVW